MSTTFRDLMLSKGLLGGKYGSPGVGSKDVQDEEGGEVQEREVQEREVQEREVQEREVAITKELKTENGLFWRYSGKKCDMLIFSTLSNVKSK